eukprot:g7609.t1
MDPNPQGAMAAGGASLAPIVAASCERGYGVKRLPLTSSPQPNVSPYYSGPPGSRARIGIASKSEPCFAPRTNATTGGNPGSRPFVPLSQQKRVFSPRLAQGTVLLLASLFMFQAVLTEGSCPLISNCDCPDWGSCGNACCFMSFAFLGYAPSQVEKALFQKLATENGPDGAYYLQTLDGGHYGFTGFSGFHPPAKHETDGALSRLEHKKVVVRYNDTMNFLLYEATEKYAKEVGERGGRVVTVLRATSTSEVGGAFGDSGQNYYNIVTLLDAIKLPHHEITTDRFGCPFPSVSGGDFVVSGEPGAASNAADTTDVSTAGVVMLEDRQPVGVRGAEAERGRGERLQDLVGSGTAAGVAENKDESSRIAEKQEQLAGATGRASDFTYEEVASTPVTQRSFDEMYFPVITEQLTAGTPFGKLLQMREVAEKRLRQSLGDVKELVIQRGEL